MLTPSPSPSTVVDDDENAGDEEYIKRQQTKRLTHGATQEELDERLRFPEPLPPVPPLSLACTFHCPPAIGLIPYRSPAAVCKCSQTQYLSPYAKREILDYQVVHFIGARSEKKQAAAENNLCDYGYDDECGDYRVVTHDHLAFRYEAMDTLGKSSSGRVLSCRDHCTSQSVALKIIRNEKRLHHQALVEIRILVKEVASPFSKVDRDKTERGCHSCTETAYRRLISDVPLKTHRKH